MRIRKRSVLLSPPLSAALSLADLSPHKTPLQVEDEEEKTVGAAAAVAHGCGGKKEAGGALHLHHCSSDSPHQPIQRPREDDRLPSDLQLVITRGKNGWICSDGDGHKGCCMLPNPTHVEALKGGGGEEDASAGNGNNKSHGKSSSAGIAAGFQLPSSSSHQVGRWCEGEKAFPLKKRRGGYEWGRGGGEEETIIEKEKKMKTKMKKTTTPAKRSEELEEEQGDGVNGGGGGIVKKRGSSASTTMEGSRCSRVNGRGWRCCQQTLVGYSLCEHHLGKGRLRSMSSVRISSKPKKNEEDDDGLLSSMLKQQQKKQLLVDRKEVGEDDEEEEKPKKKKIGTVKARSMSSLLGQTDHATVTLPLSDNIKGMA